MSAQSVRGRFAGSSPSSDTLSHSLCGMRPHGCLESGSHCSAPRMGTSLTKTVIHRLAGRAFRRVLGQKQTNYRAVLVWLDGVIMAVAGPGSGAKELDRLESIAREGDAVFRDYKY